MSHVIVGLFLLAIGLWGIFDSWHYVLDFWNGFIPIVMVLIGILSIALAMVGPENLKKNETKKTDNVT